MLSITKNRVTRFCSYIFDTLGGDNIGFVDVGSGGDLKSPWRLLPKKRLTTFNFEPTYFNEEVLPLCISDKAGKAPFYVAHDERASSLHKPLVGFVDRFGFDSMLTKETISVACLSLDDQFSGRYESVDAMDINVEGHDFQVLQGANKLLMAGAVKLLKVEFELVPIYEGQGYLSDIDAFLRARDFRLVNIEIECARSVKVRHLYHCGEPIWGKALYAPSPIHLRKRLELLQNTQGAGVARKELISAVALYTASQLLGHAYDVIEQAESIGVITVPEGQDLRVQIDYVFRWAKFESGLRLLGKLVFSVFRGLLRKK